MSVGVGRYLWYRFRSTFGRRRGGYAALALVIAILGGTAMASIAAGRRTQSSFPAFLAATRPTDLVASLFDITSATGLPSTYSAALASKVANLPGVTRTHTAIGLNAAPLRPDGSAVRTAASDVAALGSITGLYFDADRPTVVSGRMADPHRADEFVMSVDTSRLLDYHLGQVVTFGFYTNAAQEAAGFGTPAVRPLLRVEAKLVGLVVFNTQVVQDDVDRLLPPVLFTPALTTRILPLSADATGATQFGLNVVGGAAGVRAAQREFVGLVPPGSGSAFRITSAVEAKAEAAVKPESIALGVFGAIVAMAAVLVAILMISRQLRADDQGLRVLRALGADPAMTGLDGALGLLGAVSIGVLLATGTAIGLSPLAPLGPVRPVYPGGGVAIDWTVLGPGIGLLWGTTVLAILVLGHNGAPHRLAARSQSGSRRSTITRAAANAGLPAPAVAGVRFALEPGEGRTAVPVRSALVGAVLSVTVVAATLTFGSGLHTLVTHPSLYGWNWNYVLSSTNIAPPQATSRLDKDAHVAAWSGYYESSLQLDGRTVPALVGGPHSVVAPPILAGHQVNADNQIALGSATLAELRKHVGDTVIASYGHARDAPVYIPPTMLRIVGTTTLPAISKPSTGADHLTLGRGAVVSTGLVPASFQALFENPNPTLNGPELALVRLRPAVGTANGLAAMRQIADAANTAFTALPGAAGNHVAVLPAERPAQIANYQSMGAAPVLLAAGLAAGVAIALAFVTNASVRRRRRDLAVMKALGFTRYQLQAAVACQASVAAIAGVLFGVPLGIAAGRWLWREFARQIYVVPSPSVPWLSMFVVIAGAVAVANLAAALPGRAAATTSTADALRID